LFFKVEEKPEEQKPGENMDEYDQQNDDVKERSIEEAVNLKF
jgi:hypothetical protein